MKYLENLFKQNEQKRRKYEINKIVEKSFDLFDDATKKIIEELESKLVEMKIKSAKLGDKLSNSYDENSGMITPDDVEIFNELLDTFSEDYLSMERLNVLSEMKIVYLFKSIEITIKSLIHIGYPQIKTKDFYQWEILVSYFKNNNIDISNLDGYLEANELRKVNNSIKHNNRIDNEINKIREFKDEQQFSYTNIGKFHKRIKPKIQDFISSLGEAIISDLFVFDDNRIEKISDSFKIRMDEDALKILATKLTNGKRPNEMR